MSSDSDSKGPIQPPRTAGRGWISRLVAALSKTPICPAFEWRSHLWNRYLLSRAVASLEPVKNGTSWAAPIARIAKRVRRSQGEPDSVTRRPSTEGYEAPHGF